jgi:hypothetical protein
MADFPFALCKEAATIAGITPTDIGVPANDWVTKKKLVATGKFDAASLSKYADNDFVCSKDLAQGTFTVSLSLNSDVNTRGKVSINGGTPATTASVELAAGTDAVCLCTMLEGDVFDGWYNGSTKVSSANPYRFAVVADATLVAKFFYMDASPTSLDYTAEGGTKTIAIESNVPAWTVS